MIPRIDREALDAKLNADKAIHYERVKYIDGTEYLDEDGYPTDAALKLIETWHWCDPKGWFNFINSIWHLKSFGWSEGEAEHSWKQGEKVWQYHISTAGWSGNESIIHAMQNNEMQWHLSWVQSRRGGHYIFELRDDE